MLTATVYSEAGGVGKTTVTANVAVALARAGHRVLVVDLDPQEGSLSYLFDVDDDRARDDADNLVLHMIGRGRGPVEDLVRTAEHGVDIIPSHNMLSRLADLLDRAAGIEEETNPDPEYEYPREEQLLRVLRELGARETYDAILVDPPATEGPHLYNALYATRNVIIPLELSGKGRQSLDGLEDLVAGFEETLDIEIGALAVVPNGFGDTKDQRTYLEAVEKLPYDAPIVLRQRRSMFEGCWDKQCSAFTYVEEHRSRKRDHEMETLEKFETLAEHLARNAGLDIPDQEADA